jgi:hypothetical protein
MKKTILVTFTAILITALTTCGTLATGNKDASSTAPTFTGDGGKGKSIAILAPKATGLDEKHNYLPALVQGEFVSNFTGYSAISVMDRVNLETVYAELLSGYYNDDAGLDLGHLKETDYIQTGSITRTATGYALQMTITRNADKMTVASYSGTCTFVELDNLTGVRRASLDLLQKMGVEPTARTKTELAGAATTNDVKAQTALAQGIVAQQSGNEFQAMFNYFDARTFNANLTETGARIVNASTTLAANNWQNTGARGQVLSEIERMKETDRQAAEQKKNFLELLKKAIAFYKAHQPFEVKTSNYFTFDNIDHKKGTVDITVSMNLSAINTERNIIRDLRNKALFLFDDGRREPWPYDKELIYENKYVKSRLPFLWKKRIINGVEYGTLIIKADVSNEKGKKLKTLSFDYKHDDVYSMITGNIKIKTETEAKNVFSIKVDDLTDTLTVRILSIDGKSIGLYKVDQPVKVLSGVRR